MSLGGRVAEELVIQDVTTGASADLRHVSDIARRMVTQWGMSEKLGLVAYDSDQPVFMGMEYGHQNRGGYSQETAAAIDEEVRRIITEAHERATKLLKENRSILDNMSRVLVAKETIYTEEVQMLMNGAGFMEVIEATEKSENDHEANPFGRMGTPSAEELAENKKDDDDCPFVPDDAVVTETPAETTSEPAEVSVEDVVETASEEKTEDGKNE